MARGNLLLGKAKGKLGSVVFAQANGEQITRSKPASVKNPKTTGQNTQRAILATIAKLAALLTSIVDHSFANVNYGADSVRHFRKINLGILRNSVLASVGTNYNLTAKGGNAVPNYLKVSEGNLPAFSCSVDDDAVAFYMGSVTLAADDNVTVQEFKEAYPNIQGGDQLTLVKIVKTAGSLVDGDAIFALKVNRVVFAPNAFDDPNVNVFDGGYFNEILLDLTKTTNRTMLVPVDGGAGLGMGFSSDNDDTYAAALILSRKVNGKWQRSTQYMELCEFDDMADNAAAIASYGASASISSQEEYLNQADESTGKKGVKGSYANFYMEEDGEENDLTSVDAGSTGGKEVEFSEGVQVLLTCSGFGTADNPIVKATIEKGDELLIMGQKYCEWQFTTNAQNVGTYKGRVMFRDGSKAEMNWILTLDE